MARVDFFTTGKADTFKDPSSMILRTKSLSTLLFTRDDPPREPFFTRWKVKRELQSHEEMFGLRDAMCQTGDGEDFSFLSRYNNEPDTLDTGSHSSGHRSCARDTSRTHVPTPAPSLRRPTTRQTDRAIVQALTISNTYSKSELDVS
jgi:hypothetical protein